MLVLVLADTHLRTDLSKLPPEVWDHAAAADVILHAGDVVTADLLDALRAHAPVHAVLGNNDHDLAGTLPAQLDLDLAGVRIGMIHDSGPRAGRPARLLRRFPEAQMVVFGHSHEPVNLAAATGQLLFNPGSAVQRRRQPTRTLGLLTLTNTEILTHEIVPLS